MCIIVQAYFHPIERPMNKFYLKQSFIEGDRKNLMEEYRYYPKNSILYQRYTDILELYSNIEKAKREGDREEEWSWTKFFFEARRKLNTKNDLLADHFKYRIRPGVLYSEAEQRLR